MAGKLVTTVLLVVAVIAIVSALDPECVDSETVTEPVTDCLMMSVKWRFNEATGQCEPFAYPGCTSRPNAFDLESQCVATCIGAPA